MKKVIDVDSTIPLLELPKSIADVKKSVEKTIKKNNDIAPNVSGLMKYMMPPRINQRTRVMINKGKKFLRFNF